MSAEGDRPILCIGAPLLGSRYTGVGRYVETLLQGARLAGFQPLRIDPGTLQDQPGRAMRWLSAAQPGFRLAGRSAQTIYRRGLFREAQVHFDIYRRPMSVRCPGPTGIIHWAYPVPLVLEGWRNVYTIHDAIPLVAPTLTPIDGQRHRRLLEAIARRAAILVTVSQTARDEIADSAGIDRTRIVDLGEAVDVSADAAGALLPEGLSPRGYFLYCGSIEPRKNLERLVAAHAASATAYPLVIVGPNGWRAEAINAAISRNPGVVRLDYAPRATLVGLIAQARGLLMPSLAEGFGIPVAEAMTLGTPVITSAEGALAETAGDGAVKVDPTDTEAIARAIKQLDDEALCRSLSREGRRRASAFTLSSFAERLQAFYCALAGNGG
jgi:glycosyltransferase involved in cell wall biosynthesis